MFTSFKMPNLTIDGTTLDITDAGVLSIIKGAIDKLNNQIKEKESKIAELSVKSDSNDQVDMKGKKYKIGEKEKEYYDMGSLYKDMMAYVKDMCSGYEKKIKDMQMKYSNADSLDNEAFQKALKERRKVERIAVQVLKKSEQNFDGFSNKELKQAVLLSKYGENFDIKAYNDDQIDGLVTAIALDSKNSFNHASETEKSFVDETRAKLNGLLRQEFTTDSNSYDDGLNLDYAEERKNQKDYIEKAEQYSQNWLK